MTSFGFGNVFETVQRVADNAALAQAQAAGGSMRIEPDKVDEVAGFFEHEAQALEDREQQVYFLSNVRSPGRDPVSSQAAAKYGQVGAGDDQAYMGNYFKLAKVFRDTAANLRASAQQTRISDENSADGIKS